MSTATLRLGFARRAVTIGAGIALLLGTIAGPVSSVSAKDFDISVSSVADLTGLTAIAGGGDGDPIRVRANPGTDSDVITEIPDGTVVNLRVDTVDTVTQDDVRWWPVEVDGKDGWISGEWLSDSNGATASSDSSDNGDEASSSAEFAVDSYVRSQTNDNKGTNVRSKPSVDSDVLTGIGVDDVWQVIDGPNADSGGTEWYKVTNGDVTGWADARWLAQATGPDEVPDSGEFAINDWVRVSTADKKGLNLRSDATKDSRLLDALGENSRLLITDGPVLDENGVAWYEVNHFNDVGWVDSTYLVKSKKPSYASEFSTLKPAKSTAKASTASTTSSSSSSSSSSNAAPAADQPGVATGVLEAPLASYTVTQEFGCSYLGFYAYNATYGCPVHDGIDLAAPMYTEIHAADGGTVTASGWCDCGLGYYVEIDHGNGISTIYGHMAEQPWVAVGQKVAQGDVIGPVGMTGEATGPHTHFMVLVNGTAENPRNYVTFN